MMTLNRPMTALAALLTLFGLTLAGCAFDPNTLPNDADLALALDASAVNQEADIVNDSATTVLGAPGPAYTGWARTEWSVATNRREVLDSDRAAGTATVRHTRSIAGTLKVASNWAAFVGGTNLGTKAFTMEKTRLLTAEKTGRTWKVTGASYAVATSPDPGLNLVEVKIYDASSGGNLVQTIDASAMTNVMKLGELRTLPNAATVRVEAKVSRALATTVPLVYLHHAGRRAILYDDGASGDSVAGDLVYTGVFLVGRAEYKQVHVDVIDQVSINDPSAANYRSVVWNLVFKGR
ncbi:MAG: hypothetical protein J0L75_06420 [Spirochaetes bacterium]|nr:hypothetical protein [Spirochaetota bacterium]